MAPRSPAEDRPDDGPAPSVGGVPLTDLINRREFERRLERLAGSAKQYGMRHAVCYLDLDQFKIVNDTVGHMAGDELLKQVTAQLKKVGHTTGVKTVAEYAHSGAIVEALREMGVDYAQGYALGRPQPIEQLALGAAAAPSGEPERP